jgi:hypothetical protein
MVDKGANGGLNGDVVAGWAVGIGVGVGVGVGGRGVVARGPGAAGTVRRGAGVRPSTVTCGTATCGDVPGVPGGVAGAVWDGCGAGVSVAGGVVAGGGVAGGVAGGGVCDSATPERHSNASAELLRRSKRLVPIDMITPNTLTGPRRSTRHGATAPLISAPRR